METILQNLKACVIEASKNPAFVHHDWFVEYHLKLVEQISLELCGFYPKADKDAVLALVWIHDYAKILDKEHEHEEYMFEKGREKMLELGFKKDFTDKVIGYLATFEKKNEIDLAAPSVPLEVKIVSSADGAAHLSGPFMSIHWKERADKTVAELIQSNKAKIKKDWERKIVLPEAKKTFQSRYEFLKEQSGNFPKRFF